MSFSNGQKDRIINEQIKSVCCRRALLCGVFAAKARQTEQGGEMRIPSQAVAYLTNLISEQYNKPPVRITSQRGGRGTLLSISSTAVCRYLASIENSITFAVKCPSCTAHFLRGVFLAAGRVTDPEKQYRLEFSFDARTDLFLGFFAKLGLDFKCSRVGGTTRLYMKKSSSIEDFFATAQMNQTAFVLMNSKIENEIRNGVNRISNCETNNIEKSVLASRRQIDAIERLERAGLLTSLPEELESTARLRLLHRDLSIAQLAALSVPAISKPGLSHRLKRLCKISYEMLGEPSKE